MGLLVVDDVIVRWDVGNRTLLRPLGRNAGQQKCRHHLGNSSKVGVLLSPYCLCLDSLLRIHRNNLRGLLFDVFDG